MNTVINYANKLVQHVEVCKSLIFFKTLDVTCVLEIFEKHLFFYNCHYKLNGISIFLPLLYPILMFCLKRNQSFNWLKNVF